MKLKKLFWYGVTGVILLFDYAALDDITTGNEPSHTTEYIALALSVVLIFLIFRYALKKT
jgi:uncharacterized YccA/Bax inhibitor family protein